MTNTIQTSPPHTNRLFHETSPYLLQHAHNPVDWHPWGAEALEAARTQDKPIFLSIGYSACHWCHVMERESFENPVTAALMNERFINIKVDREERPDLDSIYMDAVQAMTGQGGWPMSVFLTPEGEPFYGGTYYPPEPRYGMPSWTQILHSVSNAWSQRREQVTGQAGRLVEMLRRSASIGALQREQGGDLGAETLDIAINILSQHFDSEEGGFGDHPKFPQPMTLDFCLAYFVRTGDEEALFMAELTLQNMAQGGIYDQLGGGFHRYSVDSIWLVPHFEKMLYDNAQLLRTYLHAWQISRNPLYRRVLDQTIDYLLREMQSPAGGFYSTQDADSEGEEGKFFVWTPEEVAALLPAEDAALFMAYYDVSRLGNFEGKSILRVLGSAEKAATALGVTRDEVESRLASMRATLFAAREQRIHPARDEKVLTEWNGLAIHALAECGAVLGRSDALEAAQRAADFVLNAMSQPDGRLYRTSKDGRAHLNAYLEDYAAFIRGLIALYEADFNLRWLAEASRLTQVLFDQFHDTENGGFFQTGIDHERLVARRKDYVDNAIPSGNSMAAEALQRLGVLVGNDRYHVEASRIALTMKSAMENQPTGFGRILCVTDALVSPSQEIAIVGECSDPATQALLAEARRRFLPTTVIAAAAPDTIAPLPLLEGRGLVCGKPAAYVCENYACKLPVTSVEELANLLD